MKRFARFATLAAMVAAIVAAVRALSRQDDGLPTPASGPTGSPWPPLRPEAAGGPVADATPTPDVAPAPNPAPTPAATPTAAPTPASSNGNDDEVRVPEPDGVPVAADPTPAPSASPVAGAAWAEPTAGGECPDGYPIKAKMTSKIFHSPGQLNYDRTAPDRCYVSAEAAEADGLRAAKR